MTNFSNPYAKVALYMLKIFIITLFVGLSLHGLAESEESMKGEISVKASDFQFEPHNWTVLAGQKVTFTLTNNGSQSHEWVILKHGEDVTLPFSEDDEDKIYWEIEAEPGKTTRGTFIAPEKTGIYNVVCGKKDHIEKGMLGQVVVT